MSIKRPPYFLMASPQCMFSTQVSGCWPHTARRDPRVLHPSHHPGHTHEPEVHARRRSFGVDASFFRGRAHAQVDLRPDFQACFLCPAVFWRDLFWRFFISTIYSSKLVFFKEEEKFQTDTIWNVDVCAQKISLRMYLDQQRTELW